MALKYIIAVSALLSGCAGPNLLAGFELTTVGVHAATGKTPTDHALSYATDKDCQTIRMTSDEKVCQTKVVLSAKTPVSEMERVMALRRSGLDY